MPFVIARVSYPPKHNWHFLFCVWSGFYLGFSSFGGVVSLAFTVRLGCYLLFSGAFKDLPCALLVSAKAPAGKQESIQTFK